MAIPATALGVPAQERFRYVPNFRRLVHAMRPIAIKVEPDVRLAALQELERETAMRRKHSMARFYQCVRDAYQLGNRVEDLARITELTPARIYQILGDSSEEPQAVAK